MNVRELIDALEQIEDASLPVMLPTRAWPTEVTDVRLEPARFNWDRPEVELS